MEHVFWVIMMCSTPVDTGVRVCQHTAHSVPTLQQCEYDRNIAVHTLYSKAIDMGKTRKDVDEAFNQMQVTMECVSNKELPNYVSTEHNHKNQS